MYYRDRFQEGRKEKNQFYPGTYGSLDEPPLKKRTGPLARFEVSFYERYIQSIAKVPRDPLPRKTSWG
jgi:hypothetical protein